MNFDSIYARTSKLGLAFNVDYIFWTTVLLLSISLCFVRFRQGSNISKTKIFHLLSL